MKEGIHKRVKQRFETYQTRINTLQRERENLTQELFNLQRELDQTCSVDITRQYEKSNQPMRICLIVDSNNITEEPEQLIQFVSKKLVHGIYKELRGRR